MQVMKQRLDLIFIFSFNFRSNFLIEFAQMFSNLELAVLEKEDSVAPTFFSPWSENKGNRA